MPTKFKKLISGKYFSKVFFSCYALFMCFAAYETNMSICLLSNRPHLYGAVYIIFAVISIMIILRESLRFKFKNRIYKITTSFLSCFLIYNFLVLTVWEIVCLIFSVANNIKAIGVITSLFAAILIVAYGYIRTKIIKIKPYNISLGKGNKDYRVALISDIHLGVFVGANHIRKMVAKINSLSSDIVVIAGDIFNGDNALLDDSTRLKKIAKEFCKLKTKEGVYAVVGNHDPKTSNKAFKRFIKDAGIKLLNNSVGALSKINLLGRADDAHNNRTEITDILPNTVPDKPVVVIDHKPENIPDSAKHSIDLVLCGHTHKGQLFPVTILTRLANGRDFFYGYHKHGKTHSVITSGVGFFELPVRLGSSNEIVDVKLVI